jgi:hypothetical protein
MLVAVRHLLLRFVVLTLIMIDLDSIVGNAIMYEEEEPNNDNDVPTGTTEGNNDLLAYMAGQQPSSGGIRQVLATKGAPDKLKKRQVNESTSA